MRVIEVVTDHGHLDTVKGIADQHEILDYWMTPAGEDGRCTIRLLVRPAKQQAVIDSIQTALGKIETSRIVILPVDATIPRPVEDENEKAASVVRTREELYQNIAFGARRDSNFYLLVILSTIVAAIGLIENSVAVVIGAMVIAPLLGPNIALAFASSIGDSQLFWSALRTNLTGVFIAFGLSALVGLVWHFNLNSEEIVARTDVGIAGIVLALASGAAAVLSLTSGISSALVGVMVAVAILPPTVTVGLMLAARQPDFALGALLLLAVNIVCVNLAAKLVFLFKGVKPRTWLERKKARQSVTLYTVIWLVLLVLLTITVMLRQRFLGG